jgi:hypothetical protein
VIKDFPLFGWLPVPAGEYEFDRYRVQFSTIGRLDGAGKVMGVGLKYNYAKAYGNKFGFGRKLALIPVDFMAAHFNPEYE